eukprot:GGOE01012038.1.p2 GENE.GGOE01012038.1~~GGOE01012038.1.p2  ORF type:complete len:154 (-),score=7.75 GGOE01012038.1:409-870(-)
MPPGAIPAAHGQSCHRAGPFVLETPPTLFQKAASLVAIWPLHQILLLFSAMHRAWCKCVGWPQISSVSNAIQPPSYKAHPCAIDVLFVCAAMIILCTKSWIIACMVCSGTVHVEALGLLPSALTSVSPPISALSTAPPSRFLPLAARPLLHLA